MTTYDITKFGAVGDGITLSTAAIQATIDACGDGDQVYIPVGTFVSGSIFLKSNMSLYLEEGAVLLGSNDIMDYPLYRYRFEGREQLCHGSLINTVDIRDAKPEDAYYENGYIAEVSKRLKNITIEGKGTIDANGTTLRRQMLDAGIGIRGRALALRNVDNLVIKDITIRHSPAWCVHAIYCKNVLLDGVTICTKYATDGTCYDVHNGDGFDPDSCQNVVVRNCTIESQDDCIAIKSGRDEEGRRVGIPTENVLVEDCTFRYGFGVAVGSEMSGSIRHVLVRNCVFEDTHSLGSVKAPRGRGGVIEDVVYENIRHHNNKAEHKDCKWFRGAILVDQFYSHEDYDFDVAEECGDGTALIKDIVFRNIQTSTKAGNAIFLAGLPEQYLENVQLIGVTAQGKTGMIAGNVQGLVMENVQVTADEGTTIQLINVI